MFTADAVMGCPVFSITCLTNMYAFMQINYNTTINVVICR